MTESDDQMSRPASNGRLRKVPAGAGKEPDWTRGLKRLYDSVLDEPMPDTFKDLLSKLDNDTTR